MVVVVGGGFEIQSTIKCKGSQNSRLTRPAYRSVSTSDCHITTFNFIMTMLSIMQGKKGIDRKREIKTQTKLGFLNPVSF